MSTSSFERKNNELTPITAGIGFNDGANGGFWRVQPRQKTGEDRGQWIEMGAELRAYFKNALGEAAGVSGRAIGSDGTPDGVRVLITGQADKGIPDGIYRFNTKNVRVAEGLLTDEYIESQGLDSSDLPGDIDLDNLPSIDTLERVDITPDDLRLANDGINSPEGQEMSAFKESPEGQAVARLEEAEVVSAEELQDIVEPEAKKESISPKVERASRAWLNSASRKNGDPVYLTSAGRDRVTEAWVGDDGGIYTGDVDNPSDFIGYIDDIFASMDSGRGIQSIYKGRPPLATDENGRLKVATKMDIIRMERETDARKAEAKRSSVPSSREGAENAAPARLNQNTDVRTPEGAALLEGFLRKRLAGWDANYDESPEVFDGLKAVLDDSSLSGDERLQAIADAISDARIARRGKFTEGQKTQEAVYGIYGMQSKLEKAGFETEFTRIQNAQKAREQEIMDRAIQKAMGDAPSSKETTVDDLIDEVNTPEPGDDVLDGLETPEDDLLDDVIDSDLSDPEFDLTPTRKENTFANELFGDEFISRGGVTYKVLGTEEDEDGNVAVNVVDRNGERQTFNDDSYPVITKFGKPKEAPRATPTPAPTAAPKAEPKPATPAARPVATPVATPAARPTPAPATSKPLPENAVRVRDVNDLQYGDVIYNQDGVEIGKFLGIQSKGEGLAVTIKVSKNGTVLPVRYDFIGAAYRTREEEELETPEAPATSTDKPKANAAGFTESMRDSLRGMKRTREDGIGESYARALNNGRTSTIAKDTDGSWFLEKHDEFNGGIREVKRFDSIEAALAEGTSFLNNKDPKFDAAATPGEAPATKKAEALTAGDKIYNANGTSGTVTNVTNNGGKVTVDYTDENGEPKSKRFLQGADVDTQPSSEAPSSAEKSGTPATEEQLAALDEFDALDSEEPIDDEDLRGRLFDAYNSAQDGEELDEGELQDLIDDLNMHFLTSIAANNPGILMNRKIDNGANIPAPAMSPEEMRADKPKGRGGKNDQDASLDLLAEHYPDGGFIDDPADRLNGGFVARREDIDGGATKLEVIVLRTIGNKFKVAYRFTDNTTGETQTLTHYKARESYAAIHAKEYGLDKLFDHFSGNTSPIAPTGTTARAYAKYFGPGRTWKDRMKYWRREKSRLDEADMNDAQLERLDRDFGGDVEAMAQALAIQNSKMRTFEEEFAHMGNGQDEKLNETTEEILNNKMRSGVASFYAAVERGDSAFAKARYQEMMNLIPESSPELKKLFAKTLRDGLRARLDATGVTGTQRTRALQVNSAVVSNFIINARKQWSIDNDIKLPHVSGSGVKVAKRGDMAVFEDNLGNKYVGTVATLRRKSGPNGYNDFVRMKFKDKNGKIRTLNSDLNAESVKLVDAGTEMDVLDGNAWSRLGNLVFARGKKKGGVDQAQEETDRRKAARQRKGMSWVDPTDPSYNPNLGSDGTSGDETDASFVVPKPGSKPASELGAGDTVYGTDGTPLGTITAVKMTSKDGKAIMAVKYRDADGKSKTIAYGVDQMVGPNERGGDDPKG
jgi:hypothetical protein